MAGSPLTTVMCMDWLDGLHGFDIKTAWQGMLRDATEAPPLRPALSGQDGMEWINKLHYLPNDKGHYGSVSQIQEDCHSLRLAVPVGDEIWGRRTMRRRSINALSTIATCLILMVGFFRPRNSDGQWVEDFDPTTRTEQGFIEGSGWHYQMAGALGYGMASSCRGYGSLQPAAKRILQL